jgi:hypothetical protein
MSETPVPYAVDDVIRTVRGRRVILDADLARIYGVEVKRLNEQVRRNRERFPSDFAFQLAPQDRFRRAGNPRALFQPSEGIAFAVRTRNCGVSATLNPEP